MYDLPKWVNPGGSPFVTFVRCYTLDVYIFGFTD